MVRYKETVYRKLGDLYLAVEYGDTGDLQLSFKVNALNMAIKKRGINGVLETIPTVRSLGIVFNPFKIEMECLVEELKRIEIEEKLDDLMELPSRLIKIPVWFNDPWSSECARAHGVENNLEFIARLNNMNVDEFIRIFTSTQYWIGGTGFLLGTFGSFPLEPAKVNLKIPKWTIPRKWQHERSVHIGGTSAGVYSMRSPGGHQLIGRTPIDVYDPQQKNLIFKKDPILVKASDRVEFYPITEAEYYRIRKEVEEGTYNYEVEEGFYRLSDYRGELS